MMNMKNYNKGFSLIELIIAMAISTTVLSGIVAVFHKQVVSHNTERLMVSMQQNVRAAASFMERDIRMARYDPRGFSGAAILVANEGQLSYQTDRNENGIIDADETITYALNGDELVRGDVLPFVAAAAPQVARNIDALNFDYFDANGNNISDKSVTPWVVPLNQIASIQVSIVARAGNTIPVGFTRVTDTTQYRNRSGDIIFGPANDVFRRMQVTTDIDCRN
ncbi:MAG: prepilin-type N-terminal cleavage/methylation domain-containing protein [Desulfobacterales bacterium]